MLQPKICPIMSSRVNGMCIGGKCAWWNDWGRCCSIPMLAETLADRSVQDCIFKPDAQTVEMEKAT